MAVHSPFAPRAPSLRASAHNNIKNPMTRRAMTFPRKFKTYAAAITISDVALPNTVSRHTSLNKPLPDPPKVEMTHPQAPTSPNDDPATADFDGDLEVTDDVPSKSTLDKAAEIPVTNADGEKILFKTLHEGITGQKKGHRVMVIFIRHFFCGNCQEYIRTLSACLPSPADLLAMPTPTSIVIIGCGSPSLISMYIELTGCPFPIYADPTKRLYSLLGMARTLSLGSTDPDYIQHTIVSGIVQSILQGFSRMGKGDALKAGDMRQVGGEFIFEKGKVTWCHRMRNTRDHAEMSTTKKVLGLTADDHDRPPPKRRWTTNLTRLGSTRRPSWNGRKSSESRSVGKSSRSPSKDRSPQRAQTTVAAVNGDEKSEAPSKNGSMPSLQRIVSGEVVTREPERL